MKIKMRIFFLLLLLVNLLYFTWTQGGLAAFGLVPADISSREPQRMEQQIRPKTLKITPQPSAGNAL